MSTPAAKIIEQVSPSTGKRRVSLDGGQTWLVIPPGESFPPTVPDTGKAGPKVSAVGAPPAQPADPAAPAAPAPPAAPAAPAAPAPARRTVDDIPDPAATSPTAGAHAAETSTFDAAMAEGIAPRATGRGLEAGAVPIPSAREAFTTGVSEGATLGFDAKAMGIGAMLGSLGDQYERAAGPGVSAPTSDVSDYESGVASKRAEQEAAMLYRPGMTMTGQAVGGLAPAMVSANPALVQAGVGRGLVTQGARAASRQVVGQAAERGAAQAALPTGERVVQAILQGGRLGGELGMASGAGHADFSEPGAGDVVAEHTIGGIGMGGGAGLATEALLSPLRAAGSGVWNAIKTPLTPQGRALRTAESSGAIPTVHGLEPGPKIRPIVEQARAPGSTSSPADVAAGQAAKEILPATAEYRPAIVKEQGAQMASAVSSPQGKQPVSTKSLVDDVMKIAEESSRGDPNMPTSAERIAMKSLEEIPENMNAATLEAHIADWRAKVKNQESVARGDAATYDRLLKAAYKFRKENFGDTAAIALDTRSTLQKFENEMGTLGMQKNLKGGEPTDVFNESVDPLGPQGTSLRNALKHYDPHSEDVMTRMLQSMPEEIRTQYPPEKLLEAAKLARGTAAYEDAINGLPVTQYQFWRNIIEGGAIRAAGMKNIGTPSAVPAAASTVRRDRQ